MDAAQWPQGIGIMEGSRGTIITGESRRPRPEKDKQALNCPRCNSTNTKFCYYNNYSLSQPRYMCKTCRRYWTEGGSLRTVPVGGGSRKKNINNKRRSSPLPPSSSKRQLPHHHHDLTAPNSSFPQSSTASQTSQNPNNKIRQGHDLNLAYPPPTTSSYKYSTTPCSSTSQISSMELFNFKKYEIASIYSSCGFPMQELIKPPSLNFGVDGYGNLQGVLQESGSSRSSGSASRLFFPFEDLKMQQQQQAQSSTTSTNNIADHEFYDHEKKDTRIIRGEGGDDQQAITEYWSSGMLGGGGGGGSWLA